MSEIRVPEALQSEVNYWNSILASEEVTKDEVRKTTAFYRSKIADLENRLWNLDKMRIDQIDAAERCKAVADIPENDRTIMIDEGHINKKRLDDIIQLVKTIRAKENGGKAWQDLSTEQRYMFNEWQRLFNHEKKIITEKITQERKNLKNALACINLNARSPIDVFDTPHKILRYINLPAKEEAIRGLQLGLVGVIGCNDCDAIETYALILTYAIACGMNGASEGSCIFVDAENLPSDILEKQSAIAATLTPEECDKADMNVHIDPCRKLRFRPLSKPFSNDIVDGINDELGDMRKNGEHPRLVVFNHLYSFLDHAKNRNRAEAEFINKLKHIADKWNVAVLFLLPRADAVESTALDNGIPFAIVMEPMTDRQAESLQEIVDDKPVDITDPRLYLRKVFVKYHGPCPADQWLKRGENGLLYPTELRQKASVQSPQTQSASHV